MINSYDNPTNRIVEAIIHTPAIVERVVKRFGVHPSECQPLMTVLFHHFDYPTDTRKDIQELYGAIYPDVGNYVTFINKYILAPLGYPIIESK